jgi:protocatechuate 3,4-dioxygenase beta subunit
MSKAVSPSVLDDDDRPVGRVLSRREVLALAGVTAGAAASASLAPRVAAQDASPGVSPGVDASALPSGVPSCIVRPELTEGPYYVDTGLDRSDIRSDSATGTVVDGLPLTLTYLVSRIDGTGCTPFEGALVDVWHCDARGVYSGVQDPRFDTTGQTYLRGHQLTDGTGVATFQTIYPGWYSGRAVHIHFKIRTDPSEASGLEFTSQLFFDDELSASVFTTPPYPGTQDVLNGDDAIFQDGGDQLVLNVQPAGDGMVAVFEIGVQMI